MEWQWRNDAEGLPDDDNRRCIAARVERLLIYAGQLLGLTTLPCSRFPEPAPGPTAESCALHQMDYKGLTWVHGRLTGFWHSPRFADGPADDQARYAAGRDLLAFLAFEIETRD